MDQEISASFEMLPPLAGPRLICLRVELPATLLCQPHRGRRCGAESTFHPAPPGTRWRSMQQAQLPLLGLLNTPNKWAEVSRRGQNPSYKRLFVPLSIDSWLITPTSRRRPAFPAGRFANGRLIQCHTQAPGLPGRALASVLCYTRRPAFPGRALRPSDSLASETV